MLYPSNIMRNLQPYTFNEKFAVGLLVLFGPIYLIAAVSFGPDSDFASGNFGAFILWKVSSIIVTFAALCAALATIFLEPARHSSRLRMHAGRALPLMAMALAVVFSSVAMDAFSSHQKNAFADLHERELAGPTPRAVVYRGGIPDGGIAIVRSPGRNPENFTQTVMVDLTGERIKSCEPLSDTDWTCYFD